MNARAITALALVLAGFAAALVPADAVAQSRDTRREVREGIREVEREKREARREIRRCDTRECARREIREGYREVEREKREARREIRRELREDRWRDDRYDYYRDRDDGDDVLKGVVIGAAIVGVAAAIANDD